MRGPSAAPVQRSSSVQKKIAARQAATVAGAWGTGDRPAGSVLHLRENPPLYIPSDLARAVARVDPETQVPERAHHAFVSAVAVSLEPCQEQDN